MRSFTPLWRIYIFIIFSSLITASAMIYVEWKDIKNDARIELEYANNIFTHSLDSLLRKNETLLDIIGERLIELDAFQKPVQAKHLLNSLIKKNPELAGFGLADLSGQLKTTSFTIDRKNIPNLLTTPETATSFKKALVSDNMVMGRTFYMKALNEWLIPLRYRIKNSKGEIAAVMSAGLRFDTAKSIWSEKSLPDHMNAIIIRKDLYRQYVSGIEKSSYAETYNKPVARDSYNFLNDPTFNLPEQYNKNITTVITHHSKGSIISNVSYNPIYEYYTFIYTPINILYQKLLLPVIWLAAFLILFNLTLFLVFRASISSSIKNKRDMQAMMDHSPAVIYIKDKSGRFIFINEKFEQLYNVKRINVLGKKSFDVFSKEIADSISLNDEAVINNGETFESEEKIKSYDNVFSYISTKFPLLDNNKNIYAIGVISTDTTQRKQHEHRLRSSQKMEALGKLTGGIAHDYNNMLGVILGYCDLLRDFLNDQPDLNEYVKEIEHAAQRGTKLTSKLLGFSRSKSADAEVLDLNMLLSDEQHMLEKTLTARIKLKFDLDEDLWPVWLDSNDMEDATLNIIINAMHAIEGNGEIIIQTQNQNLQKYNADLLGLKTGDYTTLSITDTGCGMDEETKEKIFDPFYSTKGDQGTGLGLSQVYGFVKRSGGQIIVYSEINHGAQFRFYFPRYQGSSEEKQIEQPSAIINLSGKETILVVDDEPALLTLLSEMLQQKGYQIFCAKDGEEALKILEASNVNLMLSDIVMPNMDGFKLATIVQEKYPSVIIQLVSGFSDEINSDSVDENLKKNLLTKPLTQQVLLERVRKLFGAG